jgi:hypothetical protein
LRFVLAALLVVCGEAVAAPEGAPWDHDGGPGRRDCSLCHFDSEAARQAQALSLEGLPAKACAGATYQLSLHLDDPALKSAGFLITAEMSGRGAGAFAAIDARTEANGAALRSTKAGVRQETKPARWEFRWTAPASIDGPIIFYVAANASNDDASAFGDKIFLSSFSLPAK